MNIGVIGLGARITTLLKTAMELTAGYGKLAAVTDLKTKEELKTMHPLVAEYIDGATMYTSAEEMLEKEQLDGVMLGTNCSTHTKFARMVLDRDIPLFLEKPVSINYEQWQILRKDYEPHDHRVVVSFPLRVSPMVEEVKKIIDSGELGRIEHVQAFNYVPYGGTYYHNWYRDDQETGGLWLQKATHDFDYINYILGFEPVQIAAMESKQIFKGDKPSGLNCTKCAEYKTCSESPYLTPRFNADTVHGKMCSFAVDTGNHDSATAIVRYDTGMHMSYTQNFFARKHAAKRGAIFSGYLGTIEFDWYTNEIKRYPHKIPRTDIYRYDDAMEAHFGGDARLVRNFIDLISGDTKVSVAPLRSGLMSALMCLNARESAQTGNFMEIKF